MAITHNHSKNKYALQTIPAKVFLCEGDKSMKFYQLVAKGHYAMFEGIGKISSRHIFQSKEKAIAYTDEFKSLVEKPTCNEDLVYLVDAKIYIVELEYNNEN